MDRLFSGVEHAKTYALYRPTYPSTVAKYVVDYAKEKNQDVALTHMIDVGCGNGQGTSMYEQYFKSITAIDPSENQIREAKKQTHSANTNYLVGCAEQLPVDDSSVDVICSAQAVHWTDFPKFWAESWRVLKPGGTLALYGYSIPGIRIAGSSESDMEDLERKAYQSIVNFRDQCHFNSRINHVNNHYLDIYHFLPGKDRIRCDDFVIERFWSLARLADCLTTWSGYQTWLKNKDPDTEDILQQYLIDVKKIFNVEDMANQNIQLYVRWSIFLLLSRRD